MPIAALCIATTVVATPAASDAQLNEIFRQLVAKHGEPSSKGSLPDADAHFMTFCRSATGVGLVLFRTSGPAPVFFEREEFCGKDVDTIDYDGDGQPEIRFYRSGGGSGTYAVNEDSYSWPPDAPKPVLGFSYNVLQADSPGPRFFYKKKNGREDMAGFDSVVKREMLPGQNCVTADYCPTWPEGTPCRPALQCDIAEDKKADFWGPLPQELISNAEWEAFLGSLMEDGYVLTGIEVPSSLKDLNLSDLSDSDTGNAPKVSAEQDAKLDAWLNN